MATTSVHSPQPQPTAKSVEARFRELKEQWQTDTQFISDAGRIIGHPAFQAIITLGDQIVPILLRELEVAPSLWVWALPEITGADPVPVADRGNIHKMTTAWLNWGRQKGIR